MPNQHSSTSSGRQFLAYTEWAVACIKAGLLLEHVIPDPEDRWLSDELTAGSHWAIEPLTGDYCGWYSFDYTLRRGIGYLFETSADATAFMRQRDANRAAHRRMEADLEDEADRFGEEEAQRQAKARRRFG